MRITRALIPLALTGALLAGCGGSGNDSTSGRTPESAAPTDNGVAALEAQAIVDKAVAALGTAKSFSMKGEIDTEGEKIAIDLKVAGKDVLGALTLDGNKIELLRVGDQNFMRPDAGAWKTLGGESGETISKLMGNKWAKLSSSDADYQSFFDIADPAELLKPDGKITKGDTKTVNGTKAVGVVQSGEDGGTLWVATTGEAYPLTLEGPSGQGQVAFGDFGATFDEIKAPADADVIDLDSLKNK